MAGLKRIFFPNNLGLEDVGKIVILVFGDSRNTKGADRRGGIKDRLRHPAARYSSLSPWRSLFPGEWDFACYGRQKLCSFMKKKGISIPTAALMDFLQHPRKSLPKERKRRRNWCRLHFKWKEVKNYHPDNVYTVTVCTRGFLHTSPQPRVDSLWVRSAANSRVRFQRKIC